MERVKAIGARERVTSNQTGSIAARIRTYLASGASGERYLTLRLAFADCSARRKSGLPGIAKGLATATAVADVAGLRSRDDAPTGDGGDQAQHEAETKKEPAANLQATEHDVSPG